MPAEFYTDLLYPLQDRVLEVFRGSPFYLSGGTALSRGYYRHRYSDDLDLFTNAHPDFPRLAQTCIESLRQTFPDVEVSVREPHFIRLFTGPQRLKIEIIDDVPSHIGPIREHPLLGRIDSRENILANKITALVDRALPKDVADIFFLLADGLGLRQALTDAESKAAGISPLLVAKLLTEFDYSLLETEISWVEPVDGRAIRDFLGALSRRLVTGQPPPP